MSSMLNVVPDHGTLYKLVSVSVCGPVRSDEVTGSGRPGLPVPAPVSRTLGARIGAED